MKTDLSELLAPLPKQPTVIESLVMQILHLIKEADLQPGDRLPSEKDIIEVTNASRPSAREALRTLKALGIIESRSGQGSFVRKLGAADVIRPELVQFALMGEVFEDIVVARRAVETEIVRLVVQDGCTQIKSAETALEVMAQHSDAREEYFDASWAFHLAIAEQCGNPALIRLLTLLYYLIRNVQIEVYLPKVDPNEEVESHRVLYKEIISGDEDRAVKAMRKHLNYMIEIVADHSKTP